MKKIFLLSSVAISLILAGCNKFLDRLPLDSTSTATFLSTDVEMEQGLVGVYAASMWVYPNNTPLHFAIEASTDIAMKRGGNAEDLVAMGDAGPFLINNALPPTCWNQAYRLVARANELLTGMEKGKDNVNARTYGRIRAEGLVLRAWAYFHLMQWFGDPIYYTKPLPPLEFEKLSRTPIATVVADLYKDMDEAAALFDANSTPAVQAMGRVNKGVALGLKAKLAFLIRDFATAAAATNTIITSGNYGLNPRYTDLFMLAGQQGNVNREIMFNQMYPTDQLNPQNWLVVLTIPRQVTTSQSSHFPSQALVDRYEGRDGLRIDASAVYNPATPRLNRDRRLGWTIYMPGDTMVHNTALAPSLPFTQPKERQVFNIHTNERIRFNWSTNNWQTIAGGNNDWIGATAAGIQWQVSATGNIGGVGYVWRKYVDSTQYSWETKTGYILMRYADILLMHAEAKIELNQLDAGMLSAINLVRARAGQPAATMGSQAQMRQLVRRERVAELAGEGHRLFDIRRWDIVLEAMNTVVVGAATNPLDPPATPTFNINDVPTYTTAKRIFSRGQTRTNTARHKLWPIPQGEIDKNPNIVQNPGWQ